MKVIYFLTRNLYPYLLPAIMSLLDHNTVEKIYVCCEDDTFPYELPPQCEIRNMTGQTYIKRSSPNWNNWFSWMTVIRPAMSKMLPDEDRVLQLDVDTIVCDDLTELWETDLGDNWIGMVNELNGPYHPYGPKYFNAGVSLINLKQIREEHADDRLIEFLNTTKVNYIDQDAWQLVGKGRVYELPQRFNESTSTSISDNPAIVHYVGIREHWRPNTPRHEFYDKYRKYEGK